MHWSGWIVALLVVINAGFMAFDGSRALIVGDYVTPKAGRFAGQLGPWSKVVSAVGIEPRSTLMKITFVVYGAAFLILTALFLRQPAPWSWKMMFVVAALGLWYVPFGTLINLVVIALLAFVGPLRP